ncbi:MAG TPA: hypothetical protein VFI45_07740 [Candidatus Acidoferrum sp.]|nr:hypothetical protein [Candidatus Acidoferrum sp.]
MTFSPKPLTDSHQNVGPVSPKFGKAVVKFHDCTEYAGCSQDKAEKIIALVRTLERAADASALSPFLSANAG